MTLYHPRHPEEEDLLLIQRRITRRPLHHPPMRGNESGAACRRVVVFDVVVIAVAATILVVFTNVWFREEATPTSIFPSPVNVPVHIQSGGRLEAFHEILHSYARVLMAFVAGCIRCCCCRRCGGPIVVGACQVLLNLLVQVVKLVLVFLFDALALGQNQTPSQRGMRFEALQRQLLLLLLLLSQCGTHLLHSLAKGLGMFGCLLHERSHVGQEDIESNNNALQRHVVVVVD